MIILTCVRAIPNIDKHFTEHKPLLDASHVLLTSRHIVKKIKTQSIMHFTEPSQQHITQISSSSLKRSLRSDLPAFPLPTPGSASPQLGPQFPLCSGHSVHSTHTVQSTALLALSSRAFCSRPKHNGTKSDSSEGRC